MTYLVTVAVIYMIQGWLQSHRFSQLKKKEKKRKKSKSPEHAIITYEQKASQHKWSHANSLMHVLMNFYLDLVYQHN